MSAPDRAARTAAADALCAGAYVAAGGPAAGAALVAVGGYGRSELAPHSDLDVVLVHDECVAPGPVVERLWYPLWDSGARVDHAVRALPEMLAAARADARVALGLLDVRHLAGDPNLTLRLRTAVLAEWRRGARERLPAVRALVCARQELMGELAHAAVPDLKESHGGLRDATVLRALVATWLVDVPHVELERSRRALLDVRDHVHELAGRAHDRVGPETWEPLAARLGLPDERAAQAHVRRLGRRVTHLSRLTWRRVDDHLARPNGVRPRRPVLAPLARGVAMAGGEVVLDRRARPADDPGLLLRAAAEAAERDAVLAPPTAARLATECAPLPDPWPAEARQLLVRLLASGRGLLPVWETLEETGALAQVLPEWERIRGVSHASTIHRFTVDRHVVETCIEASALVRDVARPDVLVLAALLHDIGKGGLTEHSVAGEPVARRIAARTGLDGHGVELVGRLVRWHLLLPATATTRDPDDPATTALVASRVGSREALGLLRALTEADARATAPPAWSSWRAGLVDALVARTAEALDAADGCVPRPAGGGTATPEQEVEVPADVADGSAPVSFRVEEVTDGSRVTVVAPDRVGLLADVSAVLALRRAPVRSARAWTQGDVAVSVWEVAADGLDAAVLRSRYDAVRNGAADPGRLLRAPRASPDGPPPSVAVRPEASERSTVLEVRTADRPGVVHLVCAALARLGVAVRSAHVDTLGPQAVDVFYVQEVGAGPLPDGRAAAAAHVVRAALSGGVGAGGAPG